MNEDLCLRTLASVMDWSNDRARAEYQWLRLMSRFKYDSYRDFVAGVRFLECLITWLTQFDTSNERQVAYAFVRQRLVYLGTAELTKLVELCYFETIKPKIAAAAASGIGVEPHRLWMHPDGPAAYAHSLRHVLFMGLSDGARTDMLRYVARGDLTNEQVIGFTQIDSDKWEDLLSDLREDTKNNVARFRHLFVLDDFTASGTSLLRKPTDKWKGKLVRLWNSMEASTMALKESPLEEEWTLGVHHYLATPRAEKAALRRHERALTERGHKWFQNVEFTFSAVLDTSVEVTKATDPDFLKLTDTYYDASVEPKKHLKESGVDHLRLGYGSCSLPLILEHNTPNNSLALLWAESTGEKGPPMRPLFRRHQRHS